MAIFPAQKARARLYLPLPIIFNKQKV